MTKTQIINLTELKSTLLSGRKNGERAHKQFNVSLADEYKIIADKDQLITSSYFLGLIGDELVKMAQIFDSVDTVISKLDLSDVNDKSKNECIRAVRRSITAPRSLMG
ncbi:hypothetical protein [Vibrio atlanticus]|uniref:hypothetical protein n=1 Tax=Vibrio atlanticus TaxID=693153 RepID=UPI003D0E31AF